MLLLLLFVANVSVDVVAVDDDGDDVDDDDDVADDVADDTGVVVDDGGGVLIVVVVVEYYCLTISPNVSFHMKTGGRYLSRSRKSACFCRCRGVASPVSSCAAINGEELRQPHRRMVHRFTDD